MLVIGHRGAAAVAPENSIVAMQRGIDLGADILEFDVQLTRDHVPIVIHDSTLFRTHKKARIVRWSTHASIKAATEKGHKIATLEEVLDMFFGKVLLNLEIKNRGSARIVVEYIKDKYIKKPSDWQNILFSSYKSRELLTIRRVSQRAELSMLHYRNPFTFMAYENRLHLTAVGFDKNRTNLLSLEVAKQLDLFVYVYTVNRPESIKRLDEKNIDGVVTDHPGIIRTAIDAVV